MQCLQHFQVKADVYWPLKCRVCVVFASVLFLLIFCDWIVSMSTSLKQLILNSDVMTWLLSNQKVIFQLHCTSLFLSQSPIKLDSGSVKALCKRVGSLFVIKDRNKENLVYESFGGNECMEIPFQHLISLLTSLSYL